ncbi:katanin p80 WD40 repeat-containing subunit B1 isoform X2 [Tripterygium wilfordii]|uniref:Katanin p80 WD40 repeat-containing subunit B1 homolog n=1 Tax=Tripterygium wilfordii TaxID=458696 RepID=A0A7J7DUG9_TRIWF|nr:katanin p80 WD40 repeat-containing subunit B1 isoform X2 [Tripterygium wilfordii]
MWKQLKVNNADEDFYKVASFARRTESEPMGGLVATDVFAVEWIRTGVIHYGMTVNYYGFISDVLELSEKYQKRYGPLRYFVAGFLKFLCLPKYSYEVEYLPASKDEQEGKHEIVDIAELYTDVMRKSNTKGFPRASSLSSIDSIMTPSRMSGGDLETCGSTRASTEPSEYVRGLDPKSKRLSSGRSNVTAEPEVIHPQLPRSTTPNWPRTRSKSRTDKGWTGLTATHDSSRCSWGNAGTNDREDISSTLSDPGPIWDTEPKWDSEPNWHVENPIELPGPLEDAEAGAKKEIAPTYEEKWVVKKGQFLGIMVCNHACRTVQSSQVVAPKAEHDDYTMDMILVHGSGRLRLLRFFLLLQIGRHLSLRYAEYVKVKSVKIKPGKHTHNGCGIDEFIAMFYSQCVVYTSSLFDAMKTPNVFEKTGYLIFVVDIGSGNFTLSVFEAMEITVSPLLALRNTGALVECAFNIESSSIGFGPCMGFVKEFVAHSANVNCLKIGRKSSRVLVTGGEDHKVNLWAIGKPNAILSLSGHTSGIDSVCFDSSEVLVAAGAASGTVKLWDLEEAKIVRTLTGHRSNCISVDFHPFGEFFASGSLDTNLKIWDIRKKGCIHTYKGHTRGVNAIRFTPDGRWIVSGGEDNTVKLWDLTAGKLFHDFKCHEGQIQCIDFHPHEFLLATGSADRTVKFWDLETFELIGSSAPETSGVRCLTFNPDGRTLLCGLHEHLKVFSWEPVRCHDAVDVGWSKLSDLNVHEGKLLGCSYNQSCVGIWVVDISRIEPYAVNNVDRLNGLSESKSSSSGNLSILNENNTKGSLGRLSVSENSDCLVKETKSLGRLSVSQNLDPVKESKNSPSTGSIPGTPPRINSNTGSKTNLASSVAVPNATAPKKNSTKAHPAVNVPIFNKSDVVPVIVPRTNARFEQPAESRKLIGLPGRTMPFSLQSKTTDFRKFANSRDEMEQPTVSAASETPDPKLSDSNSVADKNTFSTVKALIHGVTEASRNIKDDKYISSGKHETSSEPDQDESYDTNTHRVNRNVESKKGRTRSVVINLERRRRSPDYEGPTSSISPEAVSAVNMLSSHMVGTFSNFNALSVSSVFIDSPKIMGIIIAVASAGLHLIPS